MALVLVVDDDEETRKMISMVVEEAGHESMPAGDGKDAFAQIQADTLNKIKLVLTDIDMPDMNGLKLIKAVRRERPELKFIVISGYMPSHPEALILLGDQSLVSDYFSKPFSVYDVIEAIDLAIESTDNE